MEAKRQIIGIAKVQLQKELSDLGFESYRIKQIWAWIYVQGVLSFDQMTNVPAEKRKVLDDTYTLQRALVSKELISFDETRKWLLKFSDANEIEAVFIPEDERGTLCVSSQVGCTLTCKFCHTGTQKLVRNLTAGEIVAQFMHAKDAFADWPANNHKKKLTNIVMMGMGEPLLNYENVAEALKIIMDKDGLGLPKRKITLSTSGVVPMIQKCGEELGVNLAISLHAVKDELRDVLVPLNKRYPIKQLLDTCRNYPALNGREKITFEYVMLKDVNDSEADARELVKLIRGIPAKVNLIPFNPWPDAPFECSSNNQIRRFAKIIENAGYMSPVRTPRGQDILAACGQLKSESEKIRKSLAQQTN